MPPGLPAARLDARQPTARDSGSTAALVEPGQQAAPGLPASGHAPGLATPAVGTAGPASASVDGRPGTMAAWRQGAAPALASIRRFDVPCALLGLTTPPVRVQMRALVTKGRWSVLALVAAGQATLALPWLAQTIPGEVLVGPGLAPRLITTVVDALPVRLAPWLAMESVMQVDIGPHGVATVFGQGAEAQLHDLGVVLGVPRISANVPPDEPCQLTARQADVLRLAVAMGYYDLPHRVDLQQLGDAMGLTASATSQLLRRAQRKIVRAFVQAETLGHGPTELAAAGGLAAEPTPEA